MPDEYQELEQKLDRLEAKALLHGRTETIEAEIQQFCRRVDELDMGAGEDWLMKRDRELGRAFRPLRPDNEIEVKHEAGTN